MTTKRQLVWGNLLLDIGLRLPGNARSILLWVIAAYSKLRRPYSTALLRHYVEGSGTPDELNGNMGTIPDTWQQWSVKETHGKLGRRHLDPYNAHPMIPDLKNSLGHFDVVVKEKHGSRLKIYEIEKESYHFGYKPN